jgi:hypothetical protein
MTVEGDQLGPQLADALYKGPDQLCLSSLTDVRCAQRLDLPALVWAGPESG